MRVALGASGRVYDAIPDFSRETTSLLFVFPSPERLEIAVGESLTELVVAREVRPRRERADVVETPAGRATAVVRPRLARLPLALDVSA